MIPVETRKIQLTGESTLTVSLPKKWAERMRLGAGATVVLVPQSDGTILVDPRIEERRAPRKKTILAQNESPDALFRKLVGAYISSFDIIEVRSGRAMSAQVRAVVRDFRSKVIGFEVVDETASSVTLQDLFDSVDMPPKKVLRRMCMIVEKMFSDAGAALQRGDTGLAADVISRDNEVDRLCWLVSKQYIAILRDLGYAGKLGVTLEECLQYQTVAKLLERIADHAEKICQRMLKTPIPMKPEISRVVLPVRDLAQDMFSGSLDATLKGDLARAEEVVNMRGRLNELFEEAMKNVLLLDSAAMVKFAMVIINLRRAGLFATDIAEAATNYIIGLETV
jgi:phosphate uptake regulator